MLKRVAFPLILLAASALIVTNVTTISGIGVDDNSWVEKAPMNQARGGLGVTTVDGKIYAIGGSTASGAYPPDALAGGFVGTNEEYNPVTDTWTYKVAMPTPRTYFAIVSYQNKIYCIGGATGFTVDEESGFHSYTTSGVNEAYDTIADSWVTKAPMPDAGMQLQAHAVNGRIYVMDWSLTYVYDIENDSWSTEARMPPPYPKASPVSAAVGNTIVVTGEFAVGWNHVSEQKVMLYDTQTDSWSEGRSAPKVVGLGAAEATDGIKAPKRVYVLGLVAGQAKPLSINQAYDPQTDTWTTATSMPTLRIDYGTATIQDVLYVIGGYSYLPQNGGVTPIAINEQYTPLGYGTIHPAVTIISPQNQTYNTSSVSLTLTADTSASWLSYSLDGKDNITINGNTTLSGLSNGGHSITVYAKDSFGNIAVSEAVFFDVAVPEAFLTVPLAAVSIVVVVVAAAGLGCFLMKRKH